MILAALALALAPPATLPPADRDAALRAAGFTAGKGGWHKCPDPGSASYEPGRIEQAADLNGDGLPEAIVVEGSATCFGNAGYSYALVSKTSAGWRLVTQGTGMVTVLPTRGAGGWPDLEIGGPGFCFPVMRWNGRAYALHRRQYEGKPCR